MPASALPDSDAAAPPLHVGLLWHSCLSENLGVGALSVANANLIAAAAHKAGRRPVFHLMGVRGAFDYSHEIAYENHFENIGYKALLNPLSSLHKTLRQCDVVFDIGGGDSFSDIYAARRFWLIIGSKIAAQGSKGPLILSPQTIGPFHTTAARHAAVGVMNMADKVFSRDEASFKGYFGQMPWTALPYGDARIDALNSIFEVEGIPTLILLDGTTLRVLTKARRRRNREAVCV